MAKRPLPRALAVLLASCLVSLVAEAPVAAARGAGGTDSGESTTVTTTGADTGTDGAAAGGDADSELVEVQASVATLQTDRAAVRAQLQSAAAARDRQQERWALSNLAAQAAKQELDRSALVAIDAERKVADAQQRVRDYAVEAFMNPPAAGSMAVLSVSDAQSASRAHDLMAITADDQGRVVDELADAEAGARRAAAKAAEAAEEARALEEQARSELDALEEALESQRRLSVQIDQRLDSALAEAAALQQVDEEAAREMREAEVALANESRSSSSGSAPATTRQPVTASGGSSTSGGGATTTSPPTTQPAPSTPAPSPPSGVVTWSDVTKVGTFWVHRSIASNVSALLSAASAAGFSLTGGGFRDPASQIELRQAHCGTSYYDIYQKPASQCSPPTAIPGRSMHERGLALDIKSGGVLIQSRSNPAFQWLAANASRFGFYNLPSEPWHWSTNGT